MANLIITVISIALVAVAALMGAYYGGSAFMDGQAKAQANQVQSAFVQVEGALQIYNANNGILFMGDHVNVGNSFDLTATLSPQYLSAMPKPLGKSIDFYWDGSPRPNYLRLSITDINVCKQIEALRTGITPSVIGVYTLVGKIGCYDTSTDGLGYMAYYKPYG